MKTRTAVLHFDATRYNYSRVGVDSEVTALAHGARTPRVSTPGSFGIPNAQVRRVTVVVLLLTGNDRVSPSSMHEVHLGHTNRI